MASLLNRDVLVSLFLLDFDTDERSDRDDRAEDELLSIEDARQDKDSISWMVVHIFVTERKLLLNCPVVTLLCRARLSSR